MAAAAAIPELRALGESLFSQCEARLPFLALRKPEVYRRTPDWTPQAAQPLVPDAPVTVLSAAQDAGAEDLRRVSARARPAPRSRCGRTSRRSFCKTLLARPRTPGAGTGELYAALRRPLARRAHAPDAPPDAVALPRRSCCRISRYDRYVLPQSVRDERDGGALPRGAFELAGRGGGAAARSRRGRVCPVLPAAQRARRCLCSRR